MTDIPSWRLLENKRVIITPRGHKLTFPVEVWELLPCGALAIVLFIQNLECDRSNVIAIAEDGKTLWHFDPKGPKLSPFSGVYDDGSTLRLYNPEGYSFVVDIATGKQLSVMQSR